MAPWSALRYVLGLTPIPAAIVMFVTGAVLFGSDSFVEQLGFLELRQDNRSWFGLAFLTSTGLFTVYVIRICCKYGSQQLQRLQQRKKRLQLLAELSGQEKHFLRRFIKSDSATQEAEVDDGTANGLVDKGVLFRPSGIMTNPQPFNLQPWARKALRENPRLVANGSERDDTQRGLTEQSRPW
ncbi:MAG: super-infection exclusion protein B [Phycisphaerae bacterium]